ncbi:DUF2905 domain-containing protein [Candidatus Contubernalis alkaliaceticus]|uniref:DUF2905 domain-containing protein n=1 Tax=Candidatus Contubernalis alkaliaceticus TaxID=338645 RepID=UPI001F4C1BE7|nr:DUF2905 domain-containing protein [Candidatus Contubernalis alkalaceticus]UNC92622.1 DUF2905 domain-containing protein [Candidatus Contubernalis alkalaceticus]
MFNLESLGRIILSIGGLLILIGLVVTLMGRFTGLGRLPGDIFIQRDNFTFYFPLATTIIISIVLTLLLNFFRRF